MKEKIEKWFTQGLWTADMVRMAAAKGLLTPEQARLIIREEVQV